MRTGDSGLGMKRDGRMFVFGTLDAQSDRWSPRHVSDVDGNVRERFLHGKEEGSLIVQARGRQG